MTTSVWVADRAPGHFFQGDDGRIEIGSASEAVKPRPEHIPQDCQLVSAARIALRCRVRGLSDSSGRAIEVVDVPCPAKPVLKVEAELIQFGGRLRIAGASRRSRHRTIGDLLSLEVLAALTRLAARLA
jgi:hypothetical protein